MQFTVTENMIDTIYKKYFYLLKNKYVCIYGISIYMMFLLLKYAYIHLCTYIHTMEFSIEYILIKDTIKNAKVIK